MAGSSCGCSTPTTTHTASSRWWCSTARVAPWPQCCAPRAAPPAPRRAASSAAWCARSAATGRASKSSSAPTATSAPPRCWTSAARRGSNFVLGVAATTTLRGHVAALEASTAPRLAAQPDKAKLRRSKAFFDGARSWSRVERIIARVEAGPQGTDTRFVVTSLVGGDPRTVYEEIYCARGQVENHIKAWKRHLAADRSSCSKATANAFRLLLHTGAYWTLWALRSLMPKRSTWRVAQFDTLRLRLVKLAMRVVELKTRVMLHLPAACPDQAILRLVLDRLPRLAC